MAATWMNQPATYAASQRSSPARNRHATQSPSPTVSAVRHGTPARLIITGVVSPSTTASSERIAAHMPRFGDRSPGAGLDGGDSATGDPLPPAQHHPRLADGDDGTGDQHRARADRATGGGPRLGE